MAKIDFSTLTVEQLTEAKQEIARLLAEKGGLPPLKVTHHVNSGELGDHDDIDMASWTDAEPVAKEYFCALHEGDDPVEVFGEFGKLDCDWYSRNSFEFNRMPVSSDEVVEAIKKYLGG